MQAPDPPSAQFSGRGRLMSRRPSPAGTIKRERGNSRETVKCKPSKKAKTNDVKKEPAAENAVTIKMTKADRSVLSPYAYYFREHKSGHFDAECKVFDGK